MKNAGWQGWTGQKGESATDGKDVEGEKEGRGEGEVGTVARGFDVAGVGRFSQNNEQACSFLLRGLNKPIFRL